MNPSKALIEEAIGVRIASMELTDACQAGDNMAGSVQVLDVLTEDGKKISYILKKLPENPPQWIIDTEAFWREVAFYDQVVPALIKMAKSKGLDYDPPVPALLKGYNDNKNDYIILENLKSEGFQMPDKRRSLTFPEMKLVLTETACFHAVGYALLCENGGSLAKVIPNSRFFDHPHGTYPTEGEEGNYFDQMIQDYFGAAAELAQTDFPHLSARIAKIIPKAWKIRRDASLNPKHFQTITHFDIWTNNILIQYKNSDLEVPERIKIIDFQFCHVGNIYNDLQYLIFTSTTAAFRQSHLPLLLDIYYDSFMSTLAQMSNYPPPPGFTRASFMEEMKAFYGPGLVHMAFAIALQLGDFAGVATDGDVDSPEARRKEGIKRMFTRSEIAHNRWKELILEMAENGVF